MTDVSYIEAPRMLFKENRSKPQSSAEFDPP